ncbi:MAG: hypothetical protein WEE89_12545 [Gemmatimonadota bacterium]
MQRQYPRAQLADAQHNLAREYGFASWPKLRVHVELHARPADAASPVVGSWLADLSKSKSHPAPPIRAASLQFSVACDTVTISAACA